MGIYNVFSKKVLSAINQKSEQYTLRTEQIVQGKILKIFQDNKAHIQLGSQKMTAQLEASLTTGKKYLFQVKSAEGAVRLKVLGEPLKAGIQTNVQHLMSQFGVKATKTSMGFIQELITKNIPFRKDQLIKALQLIESSKHRLQAQQVLQAMIARRIPVTEPVFNALYTLKIATFTEQIRPLLQHLQKETNQKPSYQKIKNMLENIIDPPLKTKNMLIGHIAAEIKNNHPHFLNLLKAAGLIDSTVTFSAWKSEWTSFLRENNLTPSSIANRNLANVSLPNKINETLLIKILEKLLVNHSRIRSVAQQIINAFGNSLNKAIVTNLSLQGQEYAKLKKRIIRDFIPLISKGQQITLLKSLHNNPVALQNLYTNLQALSNEQTYLTVEQFLRSETREQFLSQLKLILNSIGLSHENLIKQDATEQQISTMKSLLIQVLQEENGQRQKRFRHFLNFINGMQLQSVSETNSTIQASLQFPGESIGLNGDLFLDIEGDKSENNRINPDHCRIFFYLDLMNMKETIIDMHVQNRLVAITVYNNHTDLKHSTKFLQSVLKEGLAGINYHLTTISMKSLNAIDKSKSNCSFLNRQQNDRGVDVRI
ncbi:hypothetical protein [Virgibacillus alimentarius]|uniref:hypothetical protein n=1 Tax=Virgibacillus alimentarius TaxID=698769 RepID=UPI000492FB63|nr:hypothetical protein [Virgibacillus alimentarius]